MQKLRFFWVLILLSVRILAFAQNEAGEADDPCINRQTTFDGQKLLLPKGFRPFLFKFSPSGIHYGVGNGIVEVAEWGTTDTYTLIPQEPIIYFKNQNAIGILKSNSSKFPYDDSINMDYHDTDFTTMYSVNHLMKGIIYRWIDYDSISIGGRCNGTGYYFLEWKPVGIPFDSPQITQRDSYERWKKNIRPEDFHCDQDFQQYGTFKEIRSGDLLKIVRSNKYPKGIEVYYKIKGSNKWFDVSPVNSYDRTSINPFFINYNGNRQLERKLKNDDTEFIFLDNRWFSPGTPKKLYRVFSRVYDK